MRYGAALLCVAACCAAATGQTQGVGAGRVGPFAPPPPYPTLPAVAPVFTGLPYVSGFHYIGERWVSRGGQAVTDVAYVNARFQTLAWSRNGGSVALGTLPGDYGSQPVAVSLNGAAVIGNSQADAFGGYRTHAFRWSESTGMESLGALPGHNESLVTALSGNGGVVVGISSGQTTVNDSHVDATSLFRWTQAGGMQELPAPSWASGSVTASAVNFSGNVIAGTFFSGARNYDRGFVWTAQGTGVGQGGVAEGTLEPLPAPALLPNGLAMEINAMNDAGDVIVGTCGYATGVMWQRDRLTGEWSAQTLGGGARIRPLGVSDDGGVVVGNGSNPNTGLSFAAVWTPRFGTVDLNVVLPQMGIDLHGWWLGSVTAVSPDGTQLSGTGSNRYGQYAWTISGLTVVPAPSALGAAGCVLGLVGKRRRL